MAPPIVFHPIALAKIQFFKGASRSCGQTLDIARARTGDGNELA